MTTGLRVIFTVSVIMNVLLMGAAAGFFVQRWSVSPSWEITREALSPESRNIVARVFQKFHRDVKEDVGAVRSARKEMVQILKAESFDEAAFDKVQAKMQKAQFKVMEQKALITKDLAMQLSGDDRQKLAENLVKALGGYERRVHRHREPRPLTKNEAGAVVRPKIERSPALKPN